MPIIHWFRRDLRVTDNTALNAALAESREILPVYVASTWRGDHRWTGAPRQEFLCGALRSLAAHIERLGGRLLIRSGPADEALERLIPETGAEALAFNRDPDPFGRLMERRVEAMAAGIGCRVIARHDATVREAGEVLTAERLPYRVFTPYSKAWLKKEPPLAGPAARPFTTPPGVAGEPLPDLARWGLAPSGCALPEAGERAARKRLADFLEGPLARYHLDRNLPVGGTTSRISPDLRWGTLSIREVFARVAEAGASGRPGDAAGAQTFASELIWREFYMQILGNYPEVLEQDFSEKFRGIAWDDPGERFDAWKLGRTGFPIVDAGMRELLATGWMHNRVRMIVAMFLAKDLHIHWREGERWFMRWLIDGEIASNNGGWQWSAGTGADAAPYFRIQNPWSQTKRYDPAGEYIRAWVPELAGVDAARFMEPPEDGRPLAPGYPPPIVDHAEEREITLERFRVERA